MGAGPEVLETLDRAEKVIRRMVTPWRLLPMSAGSFSKVPETYFKAIFGDGIGCKAIQHLLENVVPRRELVNCGSEGEWRATTYRRITRGMQFVRVLACDAYVFGYKGGFTERELVEQGLRWTIMDWCGVAIKQVKTHLTWLSGFGRDVVAPTDGLIDLPGLVLTPKLRLWLKQTLRKSKAVDPLDCVFTRREVVAETCLLGSKRGFPSEEDDMVELAGQTYMAQMSKDYEPGEIEPIWSLEGHEVLNRVKAEISRTSTEMFGTVARVPYRPFRPSSRAGFGAPIYRGGILGSLARMNLFDVEYLLARMVDIRGEVLEVRAYKFNSGALYQYMLDQWGMDGVEDIADCQVYFIREPLKLRTITAGSPTLYGGLSPFLKHLRRGMKKFKIFSLTRGVSDAGLVEDSMNRCCFSAYGRVDDGWDWFISGDYQQSTNDLAMWATTAACDAAFEANSEARRIVDKALGAQRIHLGGKSKASFVQARGQLMGSPLSFPILCCINAALIRCAYELVHPEIGSVPLDTLPVLINGDDLLARVSRDIEYVWRKLIAVVGWKLSPGKSYFLKELAQINSETRRVVQHVPAPHPKSGPAVRFLFSDPIPFVNGGTLHQMKKTTEQIDRSSVDTMSIDWGDRYNELSRLPTGLCARGREVLCANIDRLLQELFIEGRTPFLLNRWNPAGLGGLGIGEGELDHTLAWYGLHSRIPTKQSVLTLASEPESSSERDIQTSWTKLAKAPLLEWRETRESRDGQTFGVAPGPIQESLLLDMLLDELERYVFRSTDPTMGLPADYLDARVVGRSVPRCRPVTGTLPVESVPSPSEMEVFLRG